MVVVVVVVVVMILPHLLSAVLKGGVVAGVRGGMWLSLGPGIMMQAELRSHPSQAHCVFVRAVLLCMFVSWVWHGMAPATTKMMQPVAPRDDVAAAKVVEETDLRLLHGTAARFGTRRTVTMYV